MMIIRKKSEISREDSARFDPPREALPLAFSVSEFARTVGAGRSSIYDEIKKGKLTARKLGSRTLILHEDGIAYLRGLPVLKGDGRSAKRIPEGMNPQSA